MSPDDRTLLILDLDETLLHASDKPLARPADFLLSGFHVYKRPHLEQFLTECATRFQLAIWSAGSDSYVEAAVKRIIPTGLELAFVWGRSRCTFSVDSLKVQEDGFLDPTSHYNFAKKLKKLRRLGYRLERMLIVDDTPAKCIHNYGNAIYVEEFLGDECDAELPRLAAYLATLAEVPNVRTVEKRGWRSAFRP